MLPDTNALRRPTVVITSAVAWDGVFARPHHFAVLLAQRGWNVLFVDGPVTCIGPLKNHDLWPRAWPKHPLREVRLDHAGAAQPHHSGDAPRQPGWLRVLSPVACLPFGNQHRPINRLNQRLLAFQIRAAVEGPYILLSMLPNSIDLRAHLRPMAILYDCVDRHAEFPGFIDKATVETMERQLAHASLAVFATADTLLQRMKAWHTGAKLVANAADIEHFALTATAAVHPLLREIPEPRALFIGGVGPWIDLALLHRLAMQRPALQLVLVGPVETDVSRLADLPNVHLLGRQPYADLPQFLAGARVTLVPFAVESQVSESVNPVKVYEYLAADREVIATPIPEMRKFDAAVWLVDDGPEAGLVVDRILSGERRMPDASARRAFMASHSWDARTDVIEQALLQAAASNQVDFDNL